MRKKSKTKFEKHKKSFFPKIMKLYLTFFILSFFCNMYASNLHSQNANVTIKLSNTNLKALFNEIEKNTDYVILYTKGIVDGKTVSIDVKNKSVKEVFNQILPPLNLSYYFKDKQIVIIEDKKDIEVKTVKQSPIKIAGVVKDANNVPLAGVTVLVKGTGVASMTDGDGKYTLSVPEVITSPTLVFSYIGFETTEIEAKGRTSIDITMQEAAGQLDEVEIVAFGQQKKESVIGAVQSVKPGELRVPSSNLTNALGGRLAGVISVQRSGEPGADGASFWIRGISTFSDATSPLIFIDGVEASTGDLNALPPEAIERFSILKDAAATALYGARGANGVMLVTTKSGSNMEKARVNFRLTQSFVGPTRTVKIADGIDYMNMYNEAQLSRNPYTSTSDLRFSAEKIQATKDGINPILFPNVDWMDFMFKKMSLSQSANLNITGGTKRVDYFMSATVNNDGGMLKKDDKNNFDNNIRNLRYSFQANVNFNVTSTTKVGVRMNAQLLDYKGPAEETGTLYSRIFEVPGVYFAPTIPSGKKEDHILFGNAAGGPISDGGGGRFYQPYAEMVKGFRDKNESTFTASFNFSQKFDFITPGPIMFSETACIVQVCL